MRHSCVLLQKIQYLSASNLLIVTAHGTSRVKANNYSGETPGNYIILQHYTCVNSISTYGVYIPALWFSVRVIHRAVRTTYADARIRLVGVYTPLGTYCWQKRLARCDCLRCRRTNNGFIDYSLLDTRCVINYRRIIAYTHSLFNADEKRNEVH